MSSKYVLNEMRILKVYITYLLLKSTVYTYKIWQPNTDTSNRDNWQLDRPPTTCDNIIFPSVIEATAGWDIKDVSVKSITLPETGNLLLPQNGKIDVMDKTECSLTHDLQYTRTSVKGWLDPYNWKDSSISWAPHVERVPCSGEDVIFPNNSHISVQLPSVLLPINKIIFNEQEYVGDTWTTFLQSEDGNEYFKGPDQLRNLPWRFTAVSNSDDGVCSGGAYSTINGNYEDVSDTVFKESVCLFARPRCEETEPVKCYSPIHPEGHCCGICGSLIQIKYQGNAVKLSKVRLIVESQLQQDTNTKDIIYHLSRINNNKIQIVLINQNLESSMQIIQTGVKLEKKLKEMSVGDEVTLTYSDQNLSQSFVKQSSQVIFGTLLVILLLFISIFYIFVIHPKRSFTGLSDGTPFVRFENIVDTQDQLDTAEDPLQQESQPNQAFDNPLYTQQASTSGTQEETKKESSTPLSDDNDEDEQFENPIYSELELQDRGQNKPKTELEQLDQEKQETHNLLFEEINF